MLVIYKIILSVKPSRLFIQNICDNSTKEHYVRHSVTIVMLTT